METKTIILSEKEGKRYELHLFEDVNEFGNKLDPLIWSVTSDSEKSFIINYSGSAVFFLSLPNKEEIAEKVCEKNDVYKNYNSDLYGYSYPLTSLLSAIGEYKYFIITKTEI